MLWLRLIKPNTVDSLHVRWISDHIFNYEVITKWAIIKLPVFLKNLISKEWNKKALYIHVFVRENSRLRLPKISLATIELWEKYCADEVSNRLFAVTSKYCKYLHLPQYQILFSISEKINWVTVAWKLLVCSSSSRKDLTRCRQDRQYL